MRKRDLLLATISLTTLAGICSQQSASAQGFQVKKNATEKVNWYHAPREFQVIDDSPVVRDFREAPAAEGSVSIPAGPQGGPGGSNGGGSGAMGGGGSTLPAGGLQIGNPNATRSAPAGMGNLPKSGFGGTNIPARGMAPRGALPTGSSNNQLMGKMLNPGRGAAGAPAGGMSAPAGRSVGNYAGTPVKSYSGGYGQGSGNNYGNSDRTESSLRGKLLHQ